MSENKKLFFFLKAHDNRAEIIQSENYPKALSDGSGYFMCSRGYETEEELRKELKIQNSCSSCGNMYDAHFIEPFSSQLIERNLCHSCNHWMEVIKEIKNGNDRLVIVNSNCYSIGNEDSKSIFRGHGGSKFNFQMHDGRKIISTNVWYKGQIPEYFRDRLPDNAIQLFNKFNNKSLPTDK